VTEIVMPIRVQRRRVRGWKKPDNTICVDRTSKWGNPYVFNNDRLGIARVPAIDGSAWEVEDRCSRAGTDHAYHHPDGRVTRHKVRLMTRAECVEAYRKALLFPEKGRRLWDYGYKRYELVDGRQQVVQHGRVITADVVRAELRGFNLACYCVVGQLCHADVLLHVANQVEVAL
jgi:hypothetical protein